jgi:preprotein translocase subunit SecA
MINWLLKKIVGSKNQREINKLKPWVEKINSLEEELNRLSNQELRNKALDLFEKIKNNEELKDRITRGELIEEIVLAFALVREVAKRTLGLRHFDVQLIGGLVLHQGKIAEMKTGEGKTLVATLPAVFNGFTDRGVHIVTVNDYLARRDAQWMGPIYKFLGLEVGIINSDGKTYIVDWVDPELAEKAIKEDWRVWPKDYMEEILPEKKINVDAKRAFFTKLVEVPERRKAYECQITYGTNSEFGFDYLRDNMAMELSQIVQVKGHHYAIVDEVDSILIDEARTPLIISGPADIDPSIYYIADHVVRQLEKDKHFKLDEKQRIAYLTEEGIKKVEEILGIKNLYEPAHVELVHAILQSLRAHHLFHKNVHYIVRNGEVLIVDEFTGRVLPGRRWSDGLHQAIEVKEGVEVKPETQTFASITYQNYFRLYKKLAGMTGTAETESVEFKEIYGLDVVVIPTRKPVIRVDHPDLVFKTKRAKWKKVVEEIFLNYLIGRPVLVGTTSIEDNEHLSKLLKDSKLLKKIYNSEEFQKRLKELIKKHNLSEEEIKNKLRKIFQFGIPHNVLNAKHHEREAEIVAQAGRLNAITIATNMAGRGTDILLGGNPEYLAREKLKKKGINPQEATEEEWKKTLKEAIEETQKEKEKVKSLGGLYVIGTQRHESRRIDNQLRGRSGRQGDPGESRFIISLEDDLIRLFGGERVAKLMELLKIPEDEPIESKMVSKAIENAQKRVEAQNFQIRKRILEMDDVMNIQRNVVYGLRRQFLEGKNIKETLEKFINYVVERLINSFALADDSDLWEKESLEKQLKELTGKEIKIPEEIKDKEQLKEFLREKLLQLLSEKEKHLKENPMFKEVENPLEELGKVFLLQILDTMWRRHLHHLDRLREGIYLRGYGMRDPITEFKKEAYEMFENFLNEFYFAVLHAIYHLEIPTPGMEESLPSVEFQNVEVPPLEISPPINLSNTTKVSENSISQPSEESASSPQKPRVPKPRKLKDRLNKRNRN